MMITFNIHYNTQWGEELFLIGSIKELGEDDFFSAVPMQYISDGIWQFKLNLDFTRCDFYYSFLVKKEGNIIDQEILHCHHFLVADVNSNEVVLWNTWNSFREEHYLNTAPFKDVLIKQEYKNIQLYSSNYLIDLFLPYVRYNEGVVLLGESEGLGSWQLEKGIKLQPSEKYKWQVILDENQLKALCKGFKFAIYNVESNEIVYWEDGDNRYFSQNRITDYGDLNILEFIFRGGKERLKFAGVAIPVFSLRSARSLGVGDFADLKLMVDWAFETKQHIIQILPINDTTITKKWTDSYPYNAISIYALHPIYFSIYDSPLKDARKLKYYISEGEKLNQLPDLDYEKVYALKEAYFVDLYKEQGEAILNSIGYKKFYTENKDWLFSYACFSLLRDVFKSADYNDWDEFAIYNKDKLNVFIDDDVENKDFVRTIFMVQYLLDKQLREVKNYAETRKVVLKGDIPIGISHKSVDAWTEPNLFNLDKQTGAPPDAFSVNGQNWGFPTYNWDIMAEDNYSWWCKRFKKLSDYFSAYRIDHILGFFRIWEIPREAIYGLLGYFSPAFPYTEQEILAFGFLSPPQDFISPKIHFSDLETLFVYKTNEMLKTYLDEIEDHYYSLKSFCNTQTKIRSLNIDDTIKQALYKISEEVLFIPDKDDAKRFHPRISGFDTMLFKRLDKDIQEAFYDLHHHFFYQRHNDFWKKEALKKLPPLIQSTSMLTCGEDLGMIPACVPSVMSELEILTLEIQRMPKELGVSFTDLKTLPYLSVCTTSTHDMDTIRLWWEEDKNKTQEYYNLVLGYEGEAPLHCSSHIAEEIVLRHLQSDAMLCIILLQDYLAMDDTTRIDNYSAERINIPAVVPFYWKYRMHIPLEELLINKVLNDKIINLVETSGR